MKKQIATWQLIASSLENDIPVLLFYVVESIGSSPGRKGFFMALNGKHEMEGSIGGGIMEYKFIELGKEFLKENEKTSIIKRQVHDKKAGLNKSGMICSGEQTLLIYPVAKRNKETIQQIIDLLIRHETGSIEISPGGILLTNNIREESFQLLNENEWTYNQNIGYQNHLYIIGGGHCSLALSDLMSTMDFYIQVFDIRPDLNTVEKNYSAHEKILTESYTQLDNIIAGGNNHYVVIMTFGYRSDDEALRALMNKEFKYLGVMGSKKKIEKMFETYRREGILQTTLDKIQAPIGMQINSRTPEEIAVSIAAEIIKVKNQGQKKNK
jgi:xanthine dehydrogenase accessory factor